MRTKSPGRWAGAFFYLGKRAKTSGPARALADNANADNGERRFHRRLYRLGALPRQAAFFRRYRRPFIKILFNMERNGAQSPSKEDEKAKFQSQSITIWTGVQERPARQPAQQGRDQ
jgi:hypothetical protein